MRTSDEEKRKQKLRGYLRARGVPPRATDDEFRRASQRIRSLKARGMSYYQMGEQCGVPWNTLLAAVDGTNRGMYRAAYNGAISLRFEEPVPTAEIPPDGTLRRLKALWRDGFSIPWMTDNTPPDVLTHGQIQKLIRRKTVHYVTYATAKAVRDLYDMVDGKKPDDFGIPVRIQRYAATFATKKGCEPRHTWDPDTIDDPEAFPEWTGACGTVQGWLIHRREDIPMCSQCRGHAHDLRGPGSTNVDFDGAKLRKIRYRRGVELGVLADRIGVHKSTIMYWEQGRMKPHPNSQKLELVLRELDATPADVMEDP